MTREDRAEEASVEPVGSRHAETQVAGLTPDLRSDQATRLVLSGFVERMLACEAGIIDDLDPEWLHDYRVALRRSRSILREMKGVFPEQQVERFAAGLKRIGEVTSPLRDWQVLLAEFPGYETAVPEVLRPALAPLRAHLERKAATSHRDLTRYLTSPGYRRWMEAWRRFLARRPPKRPVAPNAARPVQEVSDRRIWKSYRRFVRAAAALHAESPAESFHALRKKGKSLRYLLETFGPLHGEGVLRRLVAPLKKKPGSTRGIAGCQRAPRTPFDTRPRAVWRRSAFGDVAGAGHPGRGLGTKAVGVPERLSRPLLLFRPQRGAAAIPEMVCSRRGGRRGRGVECNCRGKPAGRGHCSVTTAGAGRDATGSPMASRKASIIPHPQDSRPVAVYTSSRFTHEPEEGIR